jgi:hypothetical protein
MVPFTRSAGRVASSREEPELFAHGLAADDRVVLEATGNALAIARILEPHVAEVVLAAHGATIRTAGGRPPRRPPLDPSGRRGLLAAPCHAEAAAATGRTVGMFF